ncbi:thioredoxin [Haladaptatus sp. R4]|uniref:TlpA family protein disulfide reductase n=1 Tax=Haladaptatus sp. R4 TaxID=1679489 RepID=UPI0007B4ABC7|nr:TlpA disulfide reductase family protein [Haladaptatus sp. R4]KZN25267.1 thioredoxin [Haladaptatus sp. R4]
MNRRRLLTGIAGLGITGGSAWIALNGLSGDDGGLPRKVTTMRAPGSESGSVRVPVSDTVTVIDLFATWCSPCAKQMRALTKAHDEYGDDVRFVSITNERIGGTLTKGDVRSWWKKHDGQWTLGLDPDSEIMSSLNAGGLPFLAVADADGTIVWSDRGVASIDTLRSKIEAAKKQSK